MKFYLLDMRPDLKVLMREKSTQHFGEFVCGVDGFWAFWPTRPGGMSEHSLKVIQDFLEELNAPIKADIDKYFTEEGHR